MVKILPQMGFFDVNFIHFARRYKRNAKLIYNLNNKM